jgi:hypothetical protein
MQIKIWQCTAIAIYGHGSSQGGRHSDKLSVARLRLLGEQKVSFEPLKKN